MNRDDPKTLDEALDRVPYLAYLAGIPRSEMRKLVCTTWPAFDRVKAQLILETQSALESTPSGQGGSLLGPSASGQPANPATADSGPPASKQPSASTRTPRCGPWDEQPDGSAVCRKCGDVDLPFGGGPFGF